MIRTLSRRQEYVHAVSRFKRNANEVHAHQRQRRMFAARRLWAEEDGVDADLVEALFRLMVDHFVAVELAILAEREGLTGVQSQSPTIKAAAGECRDEADAR